MCIVLSKICINIQNLVNGKGYMNPFVLMKLKRDLQIKIISFSNNQFLTLKNYFTS
jgi:hypothetical protein